MHYAISMPYVVKAGAPAPISPDEQARIRKTAWDSNKNWWGAALFLFMLSIPATLATPTGFICLIISGVVFLLTWLKVEKDYAAAIVAAERSRQGGEEFHARWQADLATRHIGSMSEYRQTLDGKLKEAVAALAKARAEWSRKVYTLFWENLERSASALEDANFNRGLLLHYFSEYRKALAPEAHTFPSSPAPIVGIPDQSNVERELKELLRVGLENEKCAAVWESWRGRHEYASLDSFVSQL